MLIVSRPEPQKRLTVTPAVEIGKFDFNDIIRATCKPCSASGIALPTIISSTRSGSNAGTSFNKWLMTSAAKSSGR